MPNVAPQRDKAFQQPSHVGGLLLAVPSPALLLSTSARADQTLLLQTYHSQILLLSVRAEVPADRCAERRCGLPRSMVGCNWLERYSLCQASEGGFLLTWLRCVDCLVAVDVRADFRALVFLVVDDA